MTGFSTAIRNQYLTLTDAEKLPNFLANIIFDARCSASAQQHCVSTGLPILDGENMCELITASNVTRGHSGNQYWAESEDYLLLAQWATESECGGLELATKQLYETLLTNLESRGYPHLVKVWNYLADINLIEQDLERYRQFCIGRYNAFEKHGVTENQYPSACALGHNGGDLLVYALACKTPVQHFENPLQARAYHYPTEYGPRSPSFARATLLKTENAAKVYLSGTASVLGFATQYPDDLEKQTQVTLANVNGLLHHIDAINAAQTDKHSQGFAAEIIKVYVRNLADLPTIKQLIDQAYPNAPILYVKADICRSDLLLEIDGVWDLLA